MMKEILPIKNHVTASPLLLWFMSTQSASAAEVPTIFYWENLFHHPMPNAKNTILLDAYNNSIMTE